MVPIHVVHAENHFYASPYLVKKSSGCGTTRMFCVEVEEHGGGRSWKSVVADGLYEELDNLPEHDHAWSLLSQYANWWGAGQPQACCTGGIGPLVARLLPDPD
jgi:uncharacterized protein